MDEERDIGTDKTIVVGFTGPIASGCTTVSKFLAEVSYEEYPGVVHFLDQNNYVDESDSTLINDTVFDKIINKLFVRRVDLERKLGNGLEKNHINGGLPHKKTENIQNQLNELHSEIKILLEKREYSYSLEYLLGERHYNNRLRISCSSIIIFDVLLNLYHNNRPKDTNIPIDRRGKIHDFVFKIDQLIEQYNVDLEHVGEVYKGVSDLFHHENGLQINIEKDDNEKFKSEGVDQCFDYVQKIKKELAEEEYYREMMQDFGDNIRATGDPFHYPTHQWILDNKSRFRKYNVRIARYIDYIIHFYVNSDRQINLFLIDSFRNPQCIEYLRKRYPCFYLISLYASSEERQSRLINKLSRKNNSGFSKTEFGEIFLEQDKRDKGESIKEEYDQFFKQNVDQTVHVADIAINNEGNDKKVIFEKILRYLALIFDPGCTKPTSEEMFMNMAYTMAMKSNCISRQVGAVIEGKHGYVVGAGWNDVGAGQISCGLRNIKDMVSDQYNSLIEAFIEKADDDNLDREGVIDFLKNKYGRDYYSFCLKDDISKVIIKSKIRKIVPSPEDSSHSEEVPAECKQLYEELHQNLLGKLKIKNLQYCKALHAEENAIIQGSKLGGMGLTEATMYVTTFPCELCAKKIQQVGIKEVVYVEPYPENISEKVYLQDGALKVKTRQFEGVKGYGYYRLFKSVFDEKDWQYFEQEGFIE